MAVTVQLPILSVKKNPQNPLYTQLGVLTKGTVIEVNVSELGIVTAGGKVAWGKIRPGHKHSRKRRLCQCVRISLASGLISMT
jgi:ribosomal protein S8E